MIIRGLNFPLSECKSRPAPCESTEASLGPVGCDGAGSLPGSVVVIEILQGVGFGVSFVVWFWPVVYVCLVWGFFGDISIVVYGTGDSG